MMWILVVYFAAGISDRSPVAMWSRDFPTEQSCNEAGSAVVSNADHVTSWSRAKFICVKSGL